MVFGNDFKNASEFTLSFEKKYNNNEASFEIKEERIVVKSWKGYQRHKKVNAIIKRLAEGMSIKGDT
ncbi:MAG TPA: hypothetical protein EYP30_02690 [Archaeoglobaceae archaeon]|nr:hypothetical protein [Archaeoglobaceae archaeon]